MLISIRQKANLVELLCCPTTLSIGRVETKPSDQEDVHLLRGTKACLPFNSLRNHEMVYSNDPCVPIRTCHMIIHCLFMGQDHDVHVCMGFGGFFYPASIVCCGPEPDSLVIIHLVLMDDDTVTFAA
jgi:hypothetical protein